MQTLLTADFWILLAALVVALAISLRIRAWRRTR
jgi:hypothetical protein